MVKPVVSNVISEGGNLCMSVVCIQNNDLSMLSESAVLRYVAQIRLKEESTCMWHIVKEELMAVNRVNLIPLVTPQQPLAKLKQSQ